jgi:hypothetical protein
MTAMPVKKTDNFDGPDQPFQGSTFTFFFVQAILQQKHETCVFGFFASAEVFSDPEGAF